jgi:GNAT superfamily N-acetyltransferase
MPMEDDYAARCAARQAWLLERDGCLLGAVVVENAADHLWLDNVVVDPTRQGKGIGRALLAFVEGEARRRGHTEVRLLTNERMARNIVLYARLGYVETERREEDGFRRVFMAKRVAG